MTDNERELFALLKERSFQFGDFKLASGDRSSYYIDGKMSVVCSDGAYLIGEVLYERIKDLDIDGIGGLEVGAVPLTAATVVSCRHHGKKMEGFWVRDQAKQHGTKKIIEGKLEPKSRVVILDDVITRGQSSLKAINAVRAIDCEVVRVLSIVDRLKGARELFAAEGIDTYESVFTIRDFGVEVDDDPTTSGSAS